MGAAQHAGDPLTELAAGAAILRLRRKRGGAEDAAESERLRTVLKTQLEKPELRQHLRRRPALLREIAAEMAVEMPDLLADAFEVLGVEREGLGDLLGDLRAALARTGASPRLLETVDNLASRKTGISTAGLGRELAALLRRARDDGDLVGAVTRGLQGNVEVGISNVAADPAGAPDIPLKGIDAQQLMWAAKRSLTPAQLDELVYLTLDEKLDTIASPAAPVDIKILQLLHHAEAQGRTRQLLRGLMRWPGASPELRSVAASVLKDAARSDR
jgi:hypothetical protein